MRECKYSDDYDDPLLAELYDRSETGTDDVELIRRLIGDTGPLNVLECFSGTGRIILPLAEDGHRVTGIEIAAAMSARAAQKLAGVPAPVQERVTLRVQDALDGNWGCGYDVVLLGANAFYELPTAAAQEQCIMFARAALAPAGRLFVDNNDYKGDWAASPSEEERVVFEGTGSDGTYGRETVVGMGFDEERGILHMKRTWITRTADGQERRRELLTRKRPVSGADVEGWLRKHGFRILAVFGDRYGSPHTQDSGRAIFWAEKA